MSVGKLDSKLLGANFQAKASGSDAFWDSFIVGEHDEKTPVRIVRCKKISGAAPKKIQKARRQALLELEDPGVLAYRGVVSYKGQDFEVFHAPELSDEDPLSTRLTPVALVDRLVEILPALEDLHASGLVHGNLRRKISRSTLEDQCVITGLEDAILSDNAKSDVQDLGLYCASLLGAGPGIPTEVFLKIGNKRLNRRLCAAIQGAIGEKKYKPVRSIRDFHNILIGRARAGRMRKPPILTDNSKLVAQNRNSTSIGDKVLPAFKHGVSYGVGLTILAMLALSPALFSGPTKRITDALSNELNATSANTPVASSNDISLLTSIDDEERALADDWLDEIVPGTNPRSITVSTGATAEPLYRSELETNTARWTSAGEERSSTPTRQDIVKASASDTHVTPLANVDLALFKTQTEKWISAIAEIGDVEPTLIEDSLNTPPTRVIAPLSLALSSIPKRVGGGAEIISLWSTRWGEKAHEFVESISVDEPEVVPEARQPIEPKLEVAAKRDAGSVEFAWVAKYSPAPAPTPVTPLPIAASNAEPGRVLSSAEVSSLLGDEIKGAVSNVNLDPATVAIQTAKNTVDVMSQSTSVSQGSEIVLAANSAYSNQPPVQSAGQHFSDCITCPEMVVLTGNFQQIAMAVMETTVSQYREFLQATGRYNSAIDAGRDRSALNPGFAQTDEHPVTYVSVDDAKAFADWMSSKTGARYRLPTRSEWERAGASAYNFSVQNSNQCAVTNGADATLSSELPNRLTAKCSDGFVTTAPVGSFPANQIGLFDMLGNVSEWVLAPGADGVQVSKGGSWVSYGTDLSHEPVNIERQGARLAEVGFRLVRELE